MFPISSSRRQVALLSLGELVFTGMLVAGPAAATPVVQQSGAMLVAEAAAVPDPVGRLTDRRSGKWSGACSLCPGRSDAAGENHPGRQRRDRHSRAQQQLPEVLLQRLLATVRRLYPRVWQKAGTTKLPQPYTPKGKPV